MRPQPPSLRPGSTPLHSSGLPPPSGTPNAFSSSAPQTQPSGTVISAEQRALHLANTLVQVRQDLASAHTDLRNVRSERDSLRAELARTRARVEELEAEIAGTAKHAPPPMDPDLEQKLRGRINELEAALANARAASVAPPPPDGTDLKAVKGIGPKIEMLLHSNGITNVAQIAAWSDSDISAIAQKIGVKAARIRKDEWVGSAKRLVGSV
jgi:predicted flap endonuclease-1-like 5' DNA nuclease